MPGPRRRAARGSARFRTWLARLAPPPPRCSLSPTPRKRTRTTRTRCFQSRPVGGVEVPNKPASERTGEEVAMAHLVVVGHTRSEARIVKAERSGCQVKHRVSRRKVGRCGTRHGHVCEVIDRRRERASVLRQSPSELSLPVTRHDDRDIPHGSRLPEGHDVSVGVGAALWAVDRLEAVRARCAPRREDNVSVAAAPSIDPEEKVPPDLHTPDKILVVAGGRFRRCLCAGGDGQELRDEIQPAKHRRTTVVGAAYPTRV
mmetsp:Transcript_43003/g.99517  ORF Transcript_43003/g.99517 Transcript_43003/m.99517 type:complete len:259 (+) Transcript_43003:5787-6563(+)